MRWAITSFRCKTACTFNHKKYAEILTNTFLGGGGSEQGLSSGQIFCKFYLNLVRPVKKSWNLVSTSHDKICIASDFTYCAIIFLPNLVPLKISEPDNESLTFFFIFGPKNQFRFDLFLLKNQNCIDTNVLTLRQIMTFVDLEFYSKFANMWHSTILLLSACPTLVQDWSAFCEQALKFDHLISSSLDALCRQDRQLILF